MISLSGLAVAVGMLVDNSVVVIENIYRLRAKGATIIQAAVSGAGQVLGAVTASTLTTVCVFAPIVFVEGLTRQLFTDLALTITYSLLASLLVALTLVPAMASGMLRRPMVQKPGLLDKVYPAYRKAIAFSLDHKAGVLLLSLVLLVTSAGACLRRGFTFMPEMDMNNLSLTITMPEDTSREEAVRLADEVLERVMTVDDVQDAGFMMGGGTMGGLNMGGAMGGTSGGSYDVEGYITMPEGTFGSVAGKEIETLCADLPCEVTASGVMSGMMSYMTGSGVSLQVFGSDMADLQSSARTIARRLEQVEGVSEVSDGLDASAPALQVTIDRKAAAEKGLTVAQVYMQIAAALQSSASVSDVTLDSEDMDLTVDAAEGSVLKRENLLELELSAESSASSAMTGSASGMTGSSAAGQLTGGSEEDKTFKLGDVATVTETVSMNTISRDQQRRCVTVTAAIADGYNVTHVTSAAQQAVSGLTLPEGVTAEFNGENEQIMEAMSQLLLMLLLGVVLLCSLAESCLAAADSPCVPRYVSVAGALAITLVAAGDFRRMMGLGVETMSQLEVFSKALLPTLSAAVAAGGGYITAGARQVATVFFTDLLISLIRQVLLPLLYACIAAAAADAVVPGHSLQKIGQGLRKCAAWALTALMLVFTGFLSVTGAATSAADALSTQLTRTAIATAVPVVGSIISDAAGTVLAGAGMLKGAIGVFGLLAVLAICLTPFITMAVQYLLYKLAAFLAGTVTQEPLADLIGALGSAFGLMLGMTGSCALALLISIISSVSVVST